MTAVNKHRLRCLECDRPFREHNHIAEPGTVRHAGKGFCDRCRMRHVRGTSVNTLHVAPEPPVYDERILAIRHEHTVAGLNRLILNRRRRGVNPDGVLMPGETPDRTPRGNMAEGVVA